MCIRVEEYQLKHLAPLKIADQEHRILVKIVYKVKVFPFLVFFVLASLGGFRYCYTEGHCKQRQ